MQTLYLEPDEEVTSVIDRLKEISDSEVAVVVPKRASILQSIINLKLLRFQAEQQKKQISIVTTDKTGRNLASAVGLTVYQKLPNGKDVPEATTKAAPAATPPVVNPPVRPAKTPLGATKQTGPSIKDINFKSSAPEGAKTRALKDQAPESPPPPRPKRTAAVPETAVATSELAEETPPRSSNQSEASEPVPAEMPSPKPGPKTTRRSLSLPSVSLPKIGLPSRRKWGGALVVLGVIVALVLAFTTLLVPKATVTVTAKTDPLQAEVPVVFSARAQTMDPQTNTVPAKTIEITRQGSVEIPTTGRQAAGERASGEINVVSTLNRNQSLVARTRFQAPDGRVFRTQSRTLVPAGRSVSVTVVADEGGETNVPPGTRLSLPALSGGAIYGQTVAAIQQGASTSANPEVSNEDVERARTALGDQLAREGVADARGKLAVGFNLDEQAISATVVNADVNPPVGSPGDKLSITGSVQLTYFTYEDAVLKKMLEEDVRTKVPAGSELAGSDLRRTFFSTQSSDDTLSGTYRIDTATAPSVANDQLKQDLAGKTPQEAEAILRSSGRASAVMVDLSPFWVRRIPASADQVELEYVTAEAPAPSPSASPSLLPEPAEAGDGTPLPSLPPSL